MKKLLFLILTVLLTVNLCSCDNSETSEIALGPNSTYESTNSNESQSAEGLVYDSTDAYSYEETDEGIIITYFKNFDYIEYSKIIIPQTIDGKNVIGIGSLDPYDLNYGKVFSAVFGNCEIVIPSTVTYIGGEAFSNAKGLVKLSGGENCRVIGDRAFFNCENLTEITFLDNVTDLADNAFVYCTKWTATH